jgi:hypothetical protein
MKSLLYIGNKLSDHGYTSTSFETLGAFLEGEGFMFTMLRPKKEV